MSAVDPETLAQLADVRDPVAARLGRRVLEGHIHMLEAQIAHLTEIARRLAEQEEQLVAEQTGQGGQPEEPTERRGG